MSPASTEYRFTDQIGHLLRRAYQRHVAIFRETVPDSQLTAAQFVVLCTLRDHGSCQIPRIVLLTATHEPGDARHTEVALTPTGRSLVEQTVPIAEQISELTFGDLTPDERATVVVLLRKLAGMAPR